MKEFAIRNASLLESERLQLEADEERARSQPDFDFFKEHPPMHPKFQIGAYVASHGFNVPFIDSQEEWEKHLDAGTAMLRSEDLQDYDGWSGFFSSMVLEEEQIVTDFQDSMYNSSSAFSTRLGQLIKEGLRSHELNMQDYMVHLRGYRSWLLQAHQINEVLQMYGGENVGEHGDFHYRLPEGSRWRYIEGTNVRIFADPHVGGRYHLGVIPAKTEEDPYQSAGSYQVECDEHEVAKHFRKHVNPFIAKAYIDLYEKIRYLPAFDITQAPVMEMQADKDGNVYFLQYFKTGQRVEYVEAFDLPSPPNALITSNVRGITSRDGREMRLFLDPAVLLPEMLGQGILLPVNASLDGLGVQLAAREVNFILHQAYISFENNHFDSSPLYLPPLAAGCRRSWEKTNQEVLKRLDSLNDALSVGWRRGPDEQYYLDIKVTSNGREAVIESDWIPKRLDR